MVAVPRFRVTQDAAWVFVHVHVPFVRVSEMEFHVDGCTFSFYCKPYLLKLQFPHEVVDDELAKAVYDPNKENGTIVVHLPKKEPGLEFPDLDLLTKLLQPRQTPKVDLKATAQSKPAPLIEVVASTDNGDGENEAGVHDSSADAPTPTPIAKADSSLLDLEANMAAAVAEEAPQPVRIGSDAAQTLYGFNNAYSDFFRAWHGAVSEIISLPEPDSTPAERRREIREMAEDAQFDIERYLLDFVNAGEDPYFQLAMEYRPFWRQFPAIKSAGVLVSPPPAPTPLIMEINTQPSPPPYIDGVSASLQSMSVSSDAPHPIFSEADEELLRRLPRKEYLISRSSEEESQVVGGLVDILIGFAYEHITSQGDSGIESTWTVSILSPTLSWLDTTKDLRAVVRSAVRRMLAFPFLRQYELAIHVVRETVELLKRGKRVVLRALLELYRITEKSETQYLLNALYIQDYCVWIQGVPDDLLLRTGSELARCLACFTKGDTGWALVELERSLMEEQEGPAESSDDASSSSGSDASSSSSESDDASDGGDE